MDHKQQQKAINDYHKQYYDAICFHVRKDSKINRNYIEERAFLHDMKVSEYLRYCITKEGSVTDIRNLLTEEQYNKLVNICHSKRISIDQFLFSACLKLINKYDV